MTTPAELTTVHQAAGRALGIDVSNLNCNGAEAFSFGDYPGIAFCFIKAVEQTPGGMYYDVAFPANMAATAEIYGRKVVRHPYCFAHPGAALQPQVDALVTYGREHGMMPGDHFMMDLEVADGVAPAEVGAFGGAFLAAVNRASRDWFGGLGCRCIDYTYPAFAQAGNCASQFPWQLYIANYGVAEPEIPEPWASHGKTYRYWQYAAGEAGQMPGGRPGPDLDVYNGTRQMLNNFCFMPADRR